MVQFLYVVGGLYLLGFVQTAGWILFIVGLLNMGIEIYEGAKKV